MRVTAAILLTWDSLCMCMLRSTELHLILPWYSSCFCSYFMTWFFKYLILGQNRNERLVLNKPPVSKKHHPLESLRYFSVVHSFQKSQNATFSCLFTLITVPFGKMCCLRHFLRFLGEPIWGWIAVYFWKNAVDPNCNFQWDNRTDNVLFIYLTLVRIFYDHLCKCLWRLDLSPLYLI